MIEDRCNTSFAKKMLAICTYIMNENVMKTGAQQTRSFTLTAVTSHGASESEGGSSALSRVVLMT